MRGVGLRPGGIGPAKLLGNDLDAGHYEFRVEPDVGVRGSPALGKREVEHPVAAVQDPVAQGYNRHPLRDVGLGQVENQGFQLQTVDEDQVGGCKVSGIARGRFVGVGVDARRHQRLQVRQVPNHVADDVGQGSHRGHHLQPVRIAFRLLRLPVAVDGRAAHHPKTAHCQQTKQAKAEDFHGWCQELGHGRVLGQHRLGVQVQLRGCAIRSAANPPSESGVWQTGPIHYPATSRPLESESPNRLGDKSRCPTIR